MGPSRRTARQIDDAVHARQHQVEDDQVEGSELRAHQRLLAVGHRLGLEALEAEVEHDQLANVRFVFDDEDAGHSASFPQYFALPAPPARVPYVLSQPGHGAATKIPSHEAGPQKARATSSLATQFTGAAS